MSRKSKVLNERPKSETPKFLKGVKKRLDKLDHAKCLRMVGHLKDRAKSTDGSEDMIIFPHKAEELLGIKQRDLYALADIGALQPKKSIHSSAVLFSVTEIGALVQRSAELKAGKKIK